MLSSRGKTLEKRDVPNCYCILYFAFCNAFPPLSVTAHRFFFKCISRPEFGVFFACVRLSCLLLLKSILIMYVRTYVRSFRPPRRRRSVQFVLQKLLFYAGHNFSLVRTPQTTAELANVKLLLFPSSSLFFSS